MQTEELLRRDLECRDYLDEAKTYQLSLAQVIPDVVISDKIRPRKSYAGKVLFVQMLLALSSKNQLKVAGKYCLGPRP